MKTLAHPSDVLPRPALGSYWLNKKRGTVYVVVGMSRCSETLELRVLYVSPTALALDPPWDRPLSMWADKFVPWSRP